MVEDEGNLEEAFKRYTIDLRELLTITNNVHTGAWEKDQLRRLSVERALSGAGWKHLEVQNVGDGSGAVVHIWECVRAQYSDKAFWRFRSRSTNPILIRSPF